MRPTIQLLYRRTSIDSAEVAGTFEVDKRWSSVRRMRTTNPFSGVHGVSEVTKIGYVLGHDREEARLDTYLGMSNRPRITPFVSVRTVAVILDMPPSIR